MIHLLSAPQKEFRAVHPCLSPIFSCSPNPNKVNPFESNNVGDTVKEFLLCFKNKITPHLKTQIMQHLLEMFITETEGSDIFYNILKKNGMTTLTSGMSTLFNNKKPNLIYYLSKCFEGPTPRLPLDRMPFGMLDFNIRFFVCENTVNVRMEDHYASWLKTMISQFGHRWLCLLWAPAWEYKSETPKPNESLVQDSPNEEESIDYYILMNLM